MEWAISGSAVSLDEAAKFIRQGILRKIVAGTLLTAALLLLIFSC